MNLLYQLRDDHSKGVKASRKVSIIHMFKREAWRHSSTEGSSNYASGHMTDFCLFLHFR